MRRTCVSPRAALVARGALSAEALQPIDTEGWFAGGRGCPRAVSGMHARKQRLLGPLHSFAPTSTTPEVRAATVSVCVPGGGIGAAPFGVSSPAGWTCASARRPGDVSAQRMHPDDVEAIAACVPPFWTSSRARGTGAPHGAEVGRRFGLSTGWCASTAWSSAGSGLAAGRGRVVALRSEAVAAALLARGATDRLRDEPRSTSRAESAVRTRPRLGTETGRPPVRQLQPSPAKQRSGPAARQRPGPGDEDRGPVAARAYPVDRARPRLSALPPRPKAEETT
jgi:hypothetical protein